MNFLHLQEKIFKKISYYFHAAIFYIIKKPLYILNFNTNGNKFQCKGVLIKSTINLQGRNNPILIEQGVKLNNVNIAITGSNNKLILHKNVIFHEKGRVKLEDENNLIEVGENTDFVNCFFAVSDYNSKVIIGKDSMLSGEIIIRNSDVHSILNEENKRINPGRDVIIGDRVWVGYGANILKGSIIENDAIIGTQSVISGLHVPANSIAAGNPAKIVKTNIHWCKERIK